MTAVDNPWTIKHAGPDGLRGVVTRDGLYLLGYVMKEDRRWVTFGTDRNRVGKGYIVKDEAARSLWAAIDNWAEIPGSKQPTPRACPTCKDMTEATEIIEALVEALETGYWTMVHISRGRRFLNRARNQELP